LPEKLEPRIYVALYFRGVSTSQVIINLLIKQC